MKSIKKSSLFKEDERKIFMEMAILKEMDHPNIIKLYEIYDWQNYYYLITEYCDGGDLFEYLREKHRFSEKSAASLMKQLLSPVVYMHKKGIVHRDLKPENLMFAAKETHPILKIIDFGTSNRIKPGKNLTKEIGTPYYVAPEVLNRNYTEKCDVWSCGIILYMMLCGYPPFRGDNQKAILMNVLHEPLYFDRTNRPMQRFTGTESAATPYSSSRECSRRILPKDYRHLRRSILYGSIRPAASCLSRTRC